MNVGWDFPSNNNGRMDGLNDSGIHHFKGSLILSLVREVLQDSLNPVTHKDKHVIFKFELHELPQHEFPEIEVLKKYLIVGLIHGQVIKKQCSFS